MAGSLFLKYRCTDSEAVNHPRFPSDPILYAVKITEENIDDVAFEMDGQVNKKIPGLMIIIYNNGKHSSFAKLGDYVVTHKDLPGRYRHYSRKSFEDIYALTI